MSANQTSNESFISRWPIKKKLTWLITFVALMSVLLGGIVAVVQDISQSEEEFSEKITLIATMVGNYAAVDVEFSDAKAAMGSLSKLNEIPSILHAHLYDRNGHTFASLNDSANEQDFRLELTTQRLLTNRQFAVTMPIEFNGKHNGYIQLIASTNEIRDNIESRLITTAISGLILSIFVYALAYWLQGIISRPILSLAQTAKDISEAPDYSMRVKRSTSDEIGLLYDSFNQMLDAIEHEQQQTKNALHNLKESEARFSSMFEAIPDAVMFADVNRKIRLNNPAVFELFQYSNEELLGNTTEMLYPSHEAFMEQGKVRYNKTSTGMTLPYEVQYKRKDGSVFWTESLGTKVFTASGEHIGFLGIFRDITERKRAEEKLIQQQNEQKQILDTMVDAVISIDAFGIITSFSQGAEIMFGYSANNIIGKNVSLLMPDEYSKHHHEFINNYLETGESKIIGIGRELAGLRQSGEQFPMRLSVAELPKREDGVSRFIGTCQDISREKQQEEILQRSQKMDALGKLTGGVAHDFNNMLGVILGYSQLLENLLDDKSKEHQFNNEISKAGQRAKDLTSKLLSFSRKRPIDAKNANINQLLLDTQLMLEKTLTARIHLTMDLEENLWTVNVDKSSFIDSVLNMSINAMHVMPGGGSLTIVTKNISVKEVDAQLLGLDAGDYVKISISDTGMGMTEEIQERLFEPFFTTKGEHGTGLGLSQVYGFISQSKGTIQVFSTLGKGTRFDLYFPRDMSASIDADLNKVEEAEEVFVSANILIVDDEISLLNLAEEILSDAGYRVFSVTNGTDAINILRKEPIDLLITDIVMPKMDGYDLAEIVKKEYPKVKIQFVSGFHDIDTKQEIDKELQKNILRKPYVITELLKIIRELVRSLPKKMDKSLNILVLDDEENVHKLLALNFLKLGYNTLSSYTGEEAVEIYSAAQGGNERIDLVIVDLNIVGSIVGSIDGLEAAKEILAVDSKAKIIVSSGDTESDVMKNYKQYGFKAAMEKSFNRKELHETILNIFEESDKP